MFDVRFMKKSSRAKITVHHHKKATAVGVQNPKLTMPVQMGARVAPCTEAKSIAVREICAKLMSRVGLHCTKPSYGSRRYSVPAKTLTSYNVYARLSQAT